MTAPLGGRQRLINKLAAGKQLPPEEHNRQRRLGTQARKLAAPGTKVTVSPTGRGGRNPTFQYQTKRRKSDPNRGPYGASEFTPRKV